MYHQRPKHAPLVDRFHTELETCALYILTHFDLKKEPNALIICKASKKKHEILLRNGSEIC